MENFYSFVKKIVFRMRKQIDGMWCLENDSLWNLVGFLLEYSYNRRQI